MSFDGFISYSHAADGRLAPALQRGLHRLAKPWHRRRALWIFRDQTGLAATPALWASITQALDASEYFVLLASPSAAASPWVNREIAYWVETKSTDRILPVITDGHWDWDPERGDFTAESDAVPPALHGVFTDEPLMIDLRWTRDGGDLSLRNARFREAVAQLAAPMHGISKDDLEGEDVRQHRRLQRIRAVAVAALLFFAVAASLAGAWATRSARLADLAGAETRRQQEVAAEQRAQAQRAAAETRIEQHRARTEQQRARDAAAETQRQRKQTRDHRRLATEAAQRAARHQRDAQRQQALADRAAGTARRQQRLAEQAEANARQQRRIAQRQQRTAAAAAREARRQKREAQRHHRIAIGRRLASRAQAAIDEDPAQAFKLGLAANKLLGDTEARRDLVGLITSTSYLGTFDHGHRVAFRQDGEVMASLYNDGASTRAVLWDRQGEVELSHIDLPQDRRELATHIVFSPDGQTLAIAMNFGGVSLWDVRDPRNPIRHPGADIPGPATKITFNPDGRTLGVYTEGSASLWYATPTHSKHLSDLDSINPNHIGLTFSPDGQTVAIGGDRLGLWDISDRTRPTTIPTPPVKAGPVAFHPQRPILATGDLDGLITLWDTTEHRQLQQRTVLDLRYSIESLVISPDGNELAAGTTFGIGAVWEISNLSIPQRVTDLNNHSAVKWMAFHPTEHRLVVDGGQKAPTLWRVPGPVGKPIPITDLLRRDSRLQEAAYRSDGKALVTAYTDGSVQFWDVTDRARPKIRAHFSAHTHGVSAVAIRNDLSLLAAHGDNHTMTVWDIRNITKPTRLAEVNVPISTSRSLEMDFSFDGHRLGITDSYGIVLWSFSNPSNPVPLSNGYLRGSSFKFHPEKPMIATLSGTVVQLWDIQGPTHPTLLSKIATDGSQLIESIAFSSTGQFLAINPCNEERATALWNIIAPKKPRHISDLSGHHTSIGALSFSQGDELLATAGFDRKVAFWDMTEKTKALQVAALQLPGTEITALLFSPDRQTLTIFQQDANNSTLGSIWSISELQEIRSTPAQHLCTTTDGGLTESEWTKMIPEVEFQSSCPE